MSKAQARQRKTDAAQRRVVGMSDKEDENTEH